MNVMFARVAGSASAAPFPYGTEFPAPPVSPNIHQQEAGNWCGPACMQASVQWIWAHPNMTPFPGATPTAHPQTNLWAFMRDHSCSEWFGGDTVLPGTVGDGFQNIRKLNISYDFGADPHALAWAMYRKTPIGYFYHYYIYTANVFEATKKLLQVLETYREPSLAAVWDGSHWVLVTGYMSDRSALNPSGPGNIYYLHVADPNNGLTTWYSYNDWVAIWFTPYTNNNDPDPATGCYVPPPDHWRNHWVMVLRDDISSLTPDWAMTDNTSLIYRHCRNHLPMVEKR